MKVLHEAPAFPEIVKKITGHPQWADKRHPSMSWFTIESAIHRGLAGPAIHERMTKSEREKVANRIGSLATELAGLLQTLHGDKEWGRVWPFEFQALINRLSLDSAVDFRERMGDGNDMADLLADNEGEAFHIARCATEHLLMDGMPEIMETLAASADWWKEAGTQALPRPNSKNADRLYFIRTLTSAFMRVLATPMREVTLSITSLYFDCSTLDVAALSNLAPVRRPAKATEA